MKKFKITSFHNANDDSTANISKNSGPNRYSELLNMHLTGPDRLNDDLINSTASPGTSPLDEYLISQPLSPRTRRVQKNSMLYSLGRNGKILTFAHSDYSGHKNHCINLRYENDYNVSPLAYTEYYHPSNKYCICMITDYANKNIKAMGFILYRKKYEKNQITILDIIFYKNNDILSKHYPEFADINMETVCLIAFSNFIDEINYKCYWRPAIKWKFHVNNKATNARSLKP